MTARSVFFSCRTISQTVPAIPITKACIAKLEIPKNSKKLFDELENLKQLTAKLELNDKIVFHGRHPQSEMLNFYNLCDVCLLTLSNGSATGLTPPAKLTGYMAACRPIIASIDGAGKRIIQQADCGYVCKANDYHGLSNLMQKAIEDNSSFERFSMNGRRYFLKTFTIGKHVDELITQFKILLNNNKGVSCENTSN